MNFRINKQTYTDTHMHTFNYNRGRMSKWKCWIQSVAYIMTLAFGTIGRKMEANSFSWNQTQFHKQATIFIINYVYKFRTNFFPTLYGPFLPLAYRTSFRSVFGVIIIKSSFRVKLFRCCCHHHFAKLNYQFFFVWYYINRQHV